MTSLQPRNGTSSRPLAQRAERRMGRLRPSRRYGLVGGLLGLGAPLGYLALRGGLRRGASRGRLRDEIRRRPIAYGYMGLATPLVFGLFGRTLGKREEQLEATWGQLEKLREEFVAVVAHDLKNPIQALLLQLQLLRREARDGEVTVPLERLERLQRTAERLRALTTDLLDASLLEASRLSLVTRPTDLPAALREVLARMAPLLEGVPRSSVDPRLQGVPTAGHPVELVVEGEPPKVAADPDRLDQIATNLIENAAKYSPASAPITVRVFAEGEGAAFAVEDRGVGIQGEDMPRLFDRFYQAKRSREQKTGLGLGLYITKGLALAHGGEIRVESEPGVGSTFTVWLPAAG